MFTFVATHGVEFADTQPAVGRREATYKLWAKFERDHSLDTPTGEKRFTFSTEDASVAERLRAVKDYGITETTQAAPVQPPVVEPPAAEPVAEPTE